MVKSCKILPVMIIGILRGTYFYGWKKYSAAALITLGLVIFNFGNKSSNGGDWEVGIFGGSLLLISLFFDGLLAT